MPGMWWQTLLVPEGLDGHVLLLTRNTAYSLFERRCEEVAPLSAPAATKASLVVLGMTLVGWVRPRLRRLQVQPSWRPGDYAVFWRDAVGVHHGKFAVTTATVALEPPEHESDVLLRSMRESSGLCSLFLHDRNGS
ncbi:MAG TPA: hypothetical protein VMI75_27065 [Polyangiaceae bacterium]|nr:hypothetical protein [Polyangiaceae bacterium]